MGSTGVPMGSTGGTVGCTGGPVGMNQRASGSYPQGLQCNP